FYLLEELQIRYPRQIPLVTTNFIKSNLQSINKPPQHNYLEIQWLKLSKTIRLLSLKFKLYVKHMILFLTIAVISFWIFSIFNKNNIKLNKSTTDKLSEIQFNSKGPVWVVHLSEFDNIKEASQEAVAYRARKIRVLEIQPNLKYWNIIVPKDYHIMQNAYSKITTRVEEKWNNAKVLNLRDLCTTIRFDNNSNIILCK
ncbi:MAG: hypothetical protein SFU99_20375, partial [Saprospiraceae bacterium]|nr:hypothetical protein [Saprospiraceae bacterium]